MKKAKAQKGARRKRYARNSPYRPHPISLKKLQKMTDEERAAFIAALDEKYPTNWGPLTPRVPKHKVGELQAIYGSSCSRKGKKQARSTLVRPH